jgi:hypothetical protein
MQITFGKHAGKSLELLLLKEPDYIAWMLAQQSVYGAVKRAQDEAKRLIARFDAKPLVKDCFGRSGAHKATRCTVYGNNVTAPYWWCSTCDPYLSGANPGKLQVVASYEDALAHVALWCSGRSSDYKSLIKDLARAKGLPTRVGEKQAAEFFA